MRKRIQPLDGNGYLPYHRKREKDGGSMTTLTITAKGQITLKQELLRHLMVVPGQKIEAEKLPNGQLLVRTAVQDGSIADFSGCLAQKDGPKLTIAEINEIAASGWARRQ
jgi:antitoxin PrlF